jgi:putative addiction module component (TIGR02574 family)
MEWALNELTSKALALPLGERILLAQRLWESIEDFIDSDVEQEWLNAAEQRWKDIEEGSVQCIPAEKAMKIASGLSL